MTATESNKEQQKQRKHKKEALIFYSGVSVAVFCLVCFPLLSFAGDGAAFLKLPVGARSAALGNAATALAGEAQSLFWNPAGLAGLEAKEIAVSHSELFAGTRFESMAFGLPLQGRYSRESGNPSLVASPVWRLAAGAVLLESGGMEARGENREQLGSFSARDMAVQFGASYSVDKRTSAGFSAKVIHQKLEAESSKGWALDAGIVTRLNRLNLGAALLNVGPSMRFIQEQYQLPLTLALGTSLKLRGGMAISIDFKHEVYRANSTAGVGAELPIFNLVSLRAGYLSSLGAVQKTSSRRRWFGEGLAGLSTGLGLKVRKARFDYAFTPMGELGVTQRFSLTYRF